MGRALSAARKRCEAVVLAEASFQSVSDGCGVDLRVNACSTDFGDGTGLVTKADG
jgi:hypothetical protein